jgi:DNA invertase Pin-like site-specific DNA recombinase
MFGFMNCKLVGYLRVSTKEQGESALGLEAQKAAIAAHVAATGCVLVATYSETESGKNSDRTQLGKALARAKREKATLVIAKIDRLSRDLAFIANLMESNVPFIAADNPNVNRLTIHVLAAVAEQEARSISERTKAALAAAKERGVILGAARPGHPQLTDEARAKGRGVASKAITAGAIEAYSDLRPTIDGLRAQGLSFGAIAKRLNSERHTTRRGLPWNPVQVRRVLALPDAPKRRGRG